MGSVGCASLGAKKELYCNVVEKVNRPHHKYISYTGKRTLNVVLEIVSYIKK